MKAESPTSEYDEQTHRPEFEPAKKLAEELARLFPLLSCNQRAEVIGIIRAGYCRECYGTEPEHGCHCCNDE
jgi:hypothetical protein